MSNGATVRTLQPGEYLCLQGQPSMEMYVVKSGKLEVYVVDATGVVNRDKVESEGMLVGTVDQPNSFIGEIGAILKEPRSASIKAVETTQVMVINLHGGGFDGTILGNPKLGLNLSKQIAGRLGITGHNLTKGDSLGTKLKGHIDNFAHRWFQLFSAIEKAATDTGASAELPLLVTGRSTEAYQLGKIYEKYGSVPMDTYNALELPFRAHINMFTNRIYSGGAAAANVEVPSGEPKPGVEAFTPGAVVCKEGSIDDKMYILLAGKLEVFVGSRSIETIQGKGMIFGEMAMFGDMERSSGIRAITDVHAMPIPKDKIEAFLMAKPPVMLHVLKQFAKRLPRLNEALLITVHQMTALMTLLGKFHATFDAMIPQIKSEAALSAGNIGATLSQMESTREELEGLLNNMNTEYINLCQEIGYKPKESGEIEVKRPKFVSPTFPFIAKIEELESLDSEHINFVINPKNDMFRACSIEFTHNDLLTLAKVAKDTHKDFIFGRLLNYGESFPSQMLAFDVSDGGIASHDKEYVIRALKVLLSKMEQEIFAIYNSTNFMELCYVPDYIKVEGEEVVDEATILEFIEKFKKEPDNRENLDKLNSLYWDLIIATVNKKLPKVKDTTIPFEDSERDLINYGLLDAKFLTGNTNVFTQIEEDHGFKAPEELGLRFIYMEDVLQDIYKEAFGYNKLTKIQGQRQDLAANLKAIQDRITLLAQARQDIINSFPGGHAAVGFVQKLDSIVKTMTVLDRMMKMGRQLGPEQRAQIVAIKNSRTAINNQLSGFFTAIKGQVSEEQIKQYRDYGDEYEKKCMEDLVAQEVLAAKDREIQQHESEMKGLTLKSKENTYKNEIVRLKKFIGLTAKKCKVDPMAVLVNVRDIITRKRAVSIFELFMSENVDPDIFDPRLPRIKKQGPPAVMLIPGSGVSVYDWEKHMFLIPLNPPKTIEESIANAFVEFHWDMDEDKTLRESYGQIKLYKDLSITKLKLQLSKDYIVWATKESKNWKVLDKEVRGWFVTKIAHTKQKKEEGGAG